MPVSLVTLLSEIDSLPAPEVKARVLFKSNEQAQERIMEMRRPTYFQKIVTVSVNGVAMPPALRPIVVRTPKDIARNVHRAFSNLDGRYGSAFKCNGAFLDVRAMSPCNMAHLLMYIIPLCLHARAHCQEIGFIFDSVGGSGSPFHELLAAFDIDPIVTHKRISGNQVHVRGTRGFSVYNVRDTFDCPSITFIPDSYKNHLVTGTAQYEKIFLARRGSRALLNHTEVERLSEASGYKTIYMEDFSIEDQISIGARAKHVIATHGAAMAFLVFNPEIMSVIELLPPHVYHEFYPVALGERVKHYILIIQEFDEHIIHRGWDAIAHFKNAPFAADIELFRKALDAVR